MRHSTPTSWRRLAIAGIAGVATTLAFASPAFACHPSFEGKAQAECVTDTKGKVTWTVSPDPKGATLTNYSFTVDDKEVAGEIIAGDTGKAIGKGDALSDFSKFSVTVNKENKTAKVWIEVAGQGLEPGGGDDLVDLKIIDWTKCPLASPSPSPSTSGASPSPSAATLPVTGASTGILIGFAVVLLAAGGALVLIARRRRTGFTSA